MPSGTAASPRYSGVGAVASEAQMGRRERKASSSATKCGAASKS